MQVRASLLPTREGDFRLSTTHPLAMLFCCCSRRRFDVTPLPNAGSILYLSHYQGDWGLNETGQWNVPPVFSHIVAELPSACVSPYAAKALIPISLFMHPPSLPHVSDAYEKYDETTGSVLLNLKPTLKKSEPLTIRGSALGRCVMIQGLLLLETIKNNSNIVLVASGTIPQA
ncbi:hypothetical protein KCU61_g699, partial [Aureobasidium melanogenum]